LAPRKSEQNETGENYIMRDFVICALHQILLGWDIKEEKYIGFRHHGIGGKMTALKYLGCRGVRVVGWIHLAQDRGLLWDLVKTEINLIFFLIKKMLISELN
jgi:hypothetical protein